MLGVWIAYVTLATALLGAAAHLVEPAVKTGKRWLWGGAMLAAPALPFLATALTRLLPRQTGLDVVFGPVAPAWDTAVRDLGSMAGASPVQQVETYLVAAWIVASLALVAILAVGVVRIHRLRKVCTRERVDGLTVLLSRDFGPAVVGLRTPEIVIPPWVLALPAEERRLVLAHEEEHRRRGDPGLLAAAFALVAAMPWNAPAWWALSRLRDAVETDCDARVLAGNAGSRNRYARLLFDVGSRTSGVVPLGAGFGERISSLERRIREMLSAPTGRRRLLAQAAVAAVLVAAACQIEVNIDTKAKQTDDADPADQATVETITVTPKPTKASPEGVVRPKAKAVQKAVQAFPVFTPYTVAPSIMNRDEVVAAMEKEYPPLLRDAGIGGTVKIYFFVNAEGKAVDHRIDVSSGHEQLDEAALKVADVYRFSPALNRDQKVPVWVSFPITFQVR